jgi:hypothetical protein
VPSYYAIRNYGYTPGAFYEIKRIQVDAAGTHLYVVDQANNRVQKLPVP